MLLGSLVSADRLAVDSDLEDGIVLDKTVRPQDKCGGDEVDEVANGIHMFIQSKDLAKKSIHTKSGTKDNHVIENDEEIEEPIVVEVILEIEPILHWLALLDRNIFLPERDQLDDCAADIDQTRDTEEKSIVVNKHTEVGKARQEVVALEELDKEVVEDFSCSNSPTLSLDPPFLEFAHHANTGGRTRQGGNVKTADADTTACSPHGTQSIDNIIHLVSRVKELALDQETKRHTVDRHGIDVKSNEEANHEVRPKDTHDTTEEPPLIKGDVVEQGRLPADLVSAIGLFVQEGPCEILKGAIEEGSIRITYSTGGEVKINFLGYRIDGQQTRHDHVFNSGTCGIVSVRASPWNFSRSTLGMNSKDQGLE